MLNVSFILPGMFYGRDARKRAETYKASRELGSKLAHYYLHHILVAKACHETKSDTKDGKIPSTPSVTEIAKSCGKAYGHKKGNASEKLGLLKESICSMHINTKAFKKLQFNIKVLKKNTKL